MKVQAQGHDADFSCYRQVTSVDGSVLGRRHVLAANNICLSAVISYYTPHDDLLGKALTQCVECKGLAIFIRACWKFWTIAELSWKIVH